MGERPRHGSEIERLHQQWRVVDLAPASGAHEPSKPGRVGLSLLGRLLLERPERGEITLLGEKLFNRKDAEGPDQLIFQVSSAHIEPVALQLAPTGYRAEAGSLEPTLEEPELGNVAQTGQAEV